MALNWDKYKTYDDSQGRGNPDIWKIIFESIFGEIPKGDFESEFFKKFEKETNDFGKQKSYKNYFGTKLKYDSKNNTSLSACKSMEELKKEFRSQMMIHHPDKGGNEETCKKIIAEYERMSYKLIKIKL